MLTRFLLWRLLGVAATLLAFGLLRWLFEGGPGRVLRGYRGVRVAPRRALHAVSLRAPAHPHLARLAVPSAPIEAVALGLAAVVAVGAVVVLTRLRARRRRRYVRLRVEPYRTDRASAEAVVAMLESLHKRLLARWWRRLLRGQPSLALEVHHDCASQIPAAWLAVTCPVGVEGMVEAALRSAYPNCRLTPAARELGNPGAVVRLHKQAHFIRRVKVVDRFEHEREPAMNRLLTAMGAAGGTAVVQLALTPAPVLFEWHAKRLYKRHEARLARERREGGRVVRDRSLVEDSELRGGLEVQHRPLFFADIRVVAQRREVCERVASELRARAAENHLVERGTALRHGLLGLYAGRVARGEGNPWPSWRRGVLASTELAALWHLPAADYLTVPFARTAVALAPAPPAIMRPGAGLGTLVDALGAVSIHPEMRRQNTAVPGTVEQGKTSYLVATVAEDLRRENCAVIVLDPKGDAAEATVSLVAPQRTCTLLDLAHPTCGFNPLAVEAPADAIADYVVGALKHLFTDADIRASSDRYLRNAIIAVLAYDRRGTLWDAARLLSVGEEGYSYRARVGARVRALPEFKEISEFFTAELTAQLADARSTTTAKLDAPVNKLARLLNSPSIKRVLNDSLRVDFDRLIAEREVLVVKGALGMMGAGNTSVLMQLLVGMLDAALARQQDLVAAERRVAVALKVDEAPLVLNRGFAETMALKRSAGLETVACWQTEAQWLEREVREQLDALFAHRVYFATASVQDARAAVGLTMAEFSDTVRPGMEQLSSLGRPDARLRLPRHHAIVSWSTPEGRQAPFVARTIPLRVDRERLALHAARQAQRGGRHLADLTQPHWQRRDAEQSADDAPVFMEVEVALPEVPAESYRELVDLDGAHRVRWAKPVSSPSSLEPEGLDLEILALVAGLRHVLSSQIHRRFNPTRAATTTQRRLKRLSDAGLVERFQFHRRDGGGAPMCYVIAARGLELLRVHERLGGPAQERLSPAPERTGDAHSRMRQARHDAHVGGWALALEHALGRGPLPLRGLEESVLSPPLRPASDGHVALGPGDLRLPGGRTPHDFLATAGDGGRVAVERFQTVRPDATVEVPRGPEVAAVDVLVELDDRLPADSGAAKLERYDHLLAGWSVATKRYGSRAAARPLVVFVCRSRARARECARGADRVLTAARAYPGEYPADWEYPGRAAIVWVAERDVHEGVALAYAIPRLPPEVRVAAAHGDPRAGESTAQARSILPGPGA